ncbi:MAG: CBS domain-containing protein [Chloroflexota bacterium]|nr:CBS domain-containing protein [Candidatus Sulfotelmatobacter sp.]
MLLRNLMLTNVVTATKDCTVKDCIELLHKRHVGSVIIVDEAQFCIGIFTERDAIRVVVQNVPLDAEVEKVMTKNVFTINENATLEEAKVVIHIHKIRHLPVTNSDGKLVGLLSVRHILDELCGF